MDPTVEELSDGRWQIRLERTQGNKTASGEVIVAQSADPKSNLDLYTPLAAGRAWLELSSTLLGEGQDEGALSAVQAGLKELGEHSFASRLRVIDDTSLHIELAADLAADGRLRDAAARLQRALATRLDLYSRLHAETIVE